MGAFLHQDESICVPDHNHAFADVKMPVKALLRRTALSWMPSPG